MTPYIEIDSKSISNIDPELKEFLFKRIPDKHDKAINLEELLKNPNRNYFFMFCPYCNNIGILSCSSKIKPCICIFCGETNPYNKIMQNLEKAEILNQLAILDNCNVKGYSYENTKRILLEQSLITIATGVEVFLRDIYSTTLNLRYVKKNKTLIHLIYRETRNDFMNIGKAKRKYKNDLGIDLKEIIGEPELKKLNLMILKRNVVIHNNGNVDNSFLEQSGMDIKKGHPIPIQIDEIEDYVSTVENLVEKIRGLFEKELSDEMYQRVELFLKE